MAHNSLIHYDPESYEIQIDWGEFYSQEQEIL